MHAGVGSVEITGDHKDRLEVVGEGVDIVCLVNCLRKKLCSTEIMVVEEVKEKKPEEKKKPEEPKPCTCPGPCRFVCSSVLRTWVSSIAITGENKLEVAGEGIDFACLVKRLKKKLCHAEILKVEEVKDKKPGDEKKKPAGEHACPPSPCPWAGYHSALMTPLYCYEEPTSSSCHVM
ncbi:hypothetical protein HU200_027575 [Digitaria exilis]|uniref:Uncharacterized protein n=1 Tax=Digitaria exilis TaxID=1010633 RepID=A0A835C1N4_9POAL|nr:hypothetical protein HU200_027575 [Digitaria exilis]